MTCSPKMFTEPKTSEAITEGITHEYKLETFGEVKEIPGKGSKFKLKKKSKEKAQL